MKNLKKDNPIEYRAWCAMKTRCLNKKNKAFHHYGGRGIKIFDEWIDSFEKFFLHVGKKPSPNHSLDRINNDGNYEPGNVRWATSHQQVHNRNLKENLNTHMTTVVLPVSLHDQLKIMCVLTHTGMGQFIRIAIRDKINTLKKESKNQAVPNDIS